MFCGFCDNAGSFIRVGFGHYHGFFDIGYDISGSIGYGILGSDHGIFFTISGFGVNIVDLGTGAFRPTDSAR
jgi:hypothetical protein